VRDLLADVITTHQEAARITRSPEKHRAVVEIIRRILKSRNGER
jgi:hypothetical protein